MGRRKNDENPVSLFAFQDIITSITGIMVLVVLLIILDIIDHEEGKSSNTPSPYKEEIEKLETIENELREKLDKDKEWLNKNEEMIVKALSVDLASLPKMIEKERKKNLKLQAGIKKIENENVKLESMILQTKEEITQKKTEIKETIQQVEVKDQEVADNDKKLKELDEKLKKLEEEKEKRKNVVEIRTSDDLKQSPIFVECSEDTIKTKIIKTSKLQEFKSASKDPKELLVAFYNWLKKTRNAENECMVVIVKPSSAKYASELVTLLRQEGFSYNMEPMEEAKTGVYE